MSSPLLKLPAELRNTIYEMLAWDTVTVRVGSRGSIIDQTPLLATCHHIRNEALLTLERCSLLAARSITAEVHNFDFSHILTFIESTSGSYVHAMQGKRLCIDLSLIHI